ncbi:hypothetical protein L1987_46607 [Smallanthus sonchifolius]|uniref:Uncharacterized protein n=1 Tax=Smallanthus sonchifolius TaxID=185202 RepID=A0ACB9G1Y9_9ASTR|nr:hypothetical protein L1987_46607 [Smallanthus sonchifolius]
MVHTCILVGGLVPTNSSFPFRFKEPVVEPFNLLPHIPFSSIKASSLISPHQRPKLGLRPSPVIIATIARHRDSGSLTIFTLLFEFALFPFILHASWVDVYDDFRIGREESLGLI